MAGAHHEGGVVNAGLVRRHVFGGLFAGRRRRKRKRLLPAVRNVVLSIRRGSTPPVACVACTGVSRDTLTSPRRLVGSPTLGQCIVIAFGAATGTFAAVVTNRLSPITSNFARSTRIKLRRKKRDLFAAPTTECTRRKLSLGAYPESWGVDRARVQCEAFRGGICGV
jgi:hypothetical protein